MPLSLVERIRPVVRRMGFDVVRHDRSLKVRVPPDFDPLAVRICQQVNDYTMTSELRISALVEATAYIVRNGIEGAFVECGVWKGGSAMAVAFALLEHGITDRDIYLYDTYAGMTPPSEVDVSLAGDAAAVAYPETTTKDGISSWCYSSLDEVRRNVFSTGYPQERFRFVEGPVEKTLPGTVPPSIALLRLDTDWYESTKQELVHLYPLLTQGGVLLIDDYGHWQGCRQAVDEYFSGGLARPLFARVDGPGRIAIRLDGAA